MGLSRGRTRHRRHREWGIGFAVLGLAAGLLSVAPVSAAAAATAPSATGAQDSTGQREIVTLVTGDRVAVTHLSDGRTTAALLPGSPHFGEPIHTVALAGQLYVRPLDLSAAEARRLDASMFNVTRLAELTADDGSVPVRVTYAGDTRVHDVPGVDVDTSTARRSDADHTAARGSYSASETGGSWRGVTSVSLPGTDASDPEPAADDYELHTLTVNITDRHDKPVDCAGVIVMNLDDAGLFNWLDFCAVSGRTKLSVPEGNYAVIADAYEGDHVSIAANQRLQISDDTDITVSTKDATTPVGFPTLPGAKPLEAVFNYNRYASRGGFESGYFFGPGFGIRVQPTKPPALGDLRTSIRATLRIPHKKRPADVAETLDWQRGVPNDLTFKHKRSEFTDVTASYYSDGKQHKDQLSHGVFAFMPKQAFDIATGWPLRSPLKRHELYLGDPSVRWFQFTGIGFNSEIDTRVQTYRPGKRTSATWFRGPMAPGAGYAVRKPPRGINCPACRTEEVIRINLASFTDTQPDHWGWNWGKNPWALRRGHHLVAKGGWPQDKIEVGAAKARYSLTLRHKMPKVYDVSTHSATTWGFRSATSDRVLPLLTPRYGVPVDMMNRLPAGKASFRLAIPRLGSSAVRVAKPKVQVSYNGGKTWRRANVERRGSSVFRVKVDNPRPGDKPRYASLRVRAHDAAGNTVEQTIKRAWRIKGGASGADHPVGQGETASVPRQACGAVTDDEFRCLAIVDAYGRNALTARVDPAGYGAHELRDAYDLPSGVGEGQTVAVVVAGDYPTAAKDVNVYRQQFGLPACTVASGCFTKLNQDGVEGDYPRKDPGWALEAALDLQMISASCPSCHIVLVEANSPYFGPMAKAVDTAAANADVVNNSYGAYEFTGIKKLAQHYDVDGVPMTVSSGDYGYEPANFPASIPSVISVGGTALRHAHNQRGWAEKVWRGAGSGCSAYFAKPAWQSDTACHMRTAADVSAVADPNTGVAVYDSFGYYGQKGWFVIGGTSASSPLVAGMIASAGDADTYDGADLYDHAGTDALYDVVKGSNRLFQTCKASYICNAKPGYDAPTGIGTPHGIDAFTDAAP